MPTSWPRWTTADTPENDPLIERRARKLQEAVRFRTVSFSACGHSADRQGDRTAGNECLSAETRSELTKMRDWIESAFPLVHRHLEREIVNGYSLLYTWRGADPSRKPIMLCAHMDVVDVEASTVEKWHVDPFSGAIKDGYIYGRGTLDFKNGVVGILEAVESLLEHGIDQLESTVLLAFGHDEEISGKNGAKHIGKLLKSRNTKLDFILDEGTPIAVSMFPSFNRIAMVSIAEKGFYNMRLFIKSSGGHSSLPSPSGTILTKMSQAITALQNYPPPPQVAKSPAVLFLSALGSQHPNLFVRLLLSQTWILRLPGMLSLVTWLSPLLYSFFRTTQSVTMMEGGIAPNVIPSQASANINFRLIHGDSHDSIRKHVETVLISEKLMDPSQRKLDSRYRGDTIVIDEAESAANDPSFISSCKDETFALIRSTVLNHFSTPQNAKIIVVPSLMVAATDTKHYHGVSSQIFRFSPVEMTKDDVNRLHGANERIGVRQFSQYVEFFVRLLLDVNNCKDKNA